ncbi:MAG: gluconate 2-dehydrogenase subunit 3 family protein [Anditalea sp.]
MDRRIALKQLALITGGLMAIPACDFSRENILAAYDKLKINADHRNLLSKVVETIIPGGEILGAKELDIQDFVLVMANDCLSEEDQGTFTNGLKQFDQYVQKEYGKQFVKMDQAKAEEVFNSIVNAKEVHSENQVKEDFNRDELKHFLNTTKRLTLHGYLNSEYFMTEIMPYELIPEGFQGEKIIDPSEKINTNG